MKLRIEDITGQVKQRSFTEPQDEVNRLLDRGPIREYRVEGPLSVDISYYRTGMELLFEGEVSAELEATCARCAEEFNTPSGRPFRFILVPRAAGDRVGDDLRAEDLEFSTYKGEDIDLSPLIREQLLLSLPTRPLCDESCRGLCPVCGINLNQAVCDCSTAVPNRRLEVLRSLKVQRPAR